MNKILAVFFGLFCIGWAIFDMPVALGIIDETTGFYAREIDPIFQDPPVWLQTVGYFALLYGPVYAALAFGYWTNKAWVSTLVLPFAGLITATNVIYWAEEIWGDVPPLNWTAFVLLNLPYLLVPPIAAGRAVVARSHAPR